MLVRDLFSHPVYALRPDDSVFHARSEMITRGVSKLPVVVDEHLVGMMTKSDIVFATDMQTPPDRRKPLAEVPVSNLMATRVSTAAPDEQVAAAVRRMESRNVSGLPVVEEDRLTGILTEADVLRYAVDALEGPDGVGAVMTPDPATVNPLTTLPKAIQAMETHGIHQLPVLQDGTVVGILTMGDVVFSAWFDPRPPATERIITKRREAPGRKDREKELQGLVRDACTKDPQTTGPERSLAQASRQLSEGGFNALPVLEDDDLVGILTRTDILRRWAGYD